MFAQITMYFERHGPMGAFSELTLALVQPLWQSNWNVLEVEKLNLIICYVHTYNNNIRLCIHYCIHVYCTSCVMCMT